jgi:hypothetical protein
VVSRASKLPLSASGRRGAASWPRSGQRSHASDQWRRGNPGPVPGWGEGLTATWFPFACLDSAPQRLCPMPCYHGASGFSPSFAARGNHVAIMPAITGRPIRRICRAGSADG